MKDVNEHKMKIALLVPQLKWVVWCEDCRKDGNENALHVLFALKEFKRAWEAYRLW